MKLITFIFTFTMITTSLNVGAQNEPQSLIKPIANEIISTANDQTNLALTIYNGNLALIKDSREIQLNQGENQLVFKDVSAKIRAETASFVTQNQNNPITLLEQNFDYDLLTPAKLLEKFIGQSIKLVKTNKISGKENIIDAIVLSTNNGTVLQIGNHIETGIPGRILFPSIPDNLRSSPTLTIHLLQQKSAKQVFELSYLTGGLQWETDYIANINDDDTKISLNAWVTLNNRSGSSYKNAQLKLVAGKVNLVSNNVRISRSSMKRSRQLASQQMEMKEESLLDYHLYSLPRKTHILNNQSKQVALFSQQGIAVSKTYQLNGQAYYYRNNIRDIGKNQNPDIQLSFKNDKASSLDIALPAGIIRSYKKDKSGHLQFVGEDRIDHTAKNEMVKLKLGKAFDITITKTQTDFKKLSKFNNEQLRTENEYHFSLRNAKQSAIEVSIIEPIPGDWQILNESHLSTKLDAHTARWKINIPADGVATLHYRVKIAH